MHATADVSMVLRRKEIEQEEEESSDDMGYDLFDSDHSLSENEVVRVDLILYL